MNFNTRFVSFFSCITFCGVIYAQNTQINGLVLDPSRAPVGNAHVNLTRTDSGERRVTSSNEEGYFTFPLLQPGTYNLEIQKEGFTTQFERNLKVETGQITRAEVSLAL